MAHKGGDDSEDLFDDPARNGDFICDRDEDQQESIACDQVEEEKGVGHGKRNESHKRNNRALGILRIDTSAPHAVAFHSRRKSSASSVGDFRCIGATLNPQVSSFFPLFIYTTISFGFFKRKETTRLKFTLSFFYPIVHALHVWLFLRDAGLLAYYLSKSF